VRGEGVLAAAFDALDLGVGSASRDVFEDATAVLSLNPSEWWGAPIPDARRGEVPRTGSTNSGR